MNLSHAHRAARDHRAARCPSLRDFRHPRQEPRVTLVTWHDDYCQRPGSLRGSQR
jgi:hypothetical protein